LQVLEEFLDVSCHGVLPVGWFIAEVEWRGFVAARLRRLG